MQSIPTPRRRRISYDHYGYLFIAPFFIVFLVFQLYPLFLMFRTSTTDAVGWSRILDNSFIGLENFWTLFTVNETSVMFWSSFRNTLIVWLCNYVPQIVFALILASWFTDSRLHLRSQGAFRVLISLPNIVTPTAIGLLFFSLFSFPMAPVNVVLQKLGILSAPYDFFGNTATSRSLYSFIQWWMWYGFTMIVMISAIRSIDADLFRAALIDGCSSPQVFWKITLPLIKPVLLYNLVTSLGGGLTMFDISHMISQGGSNVPTSTVTRFIYLQIFSGNYSFSMACASSVVLFAIIIFCSLILFLLLKERDAGTDL